LRTLAPAFCEFRNQKNLKQQARERHISEPLTTPDHCHPGPTIARANVTTGKQSPRTSPFVSPIPFPTPLSLPPARTLARPHPPHPSPDPAPGGGAMDGPKRSQMRVRLRVTARRRGDGVDGAGGSGSGAGGRKRRLDAPVLNSAAKLLRREIGGRQLAACGGGPASAVPERFRNMQLQVCPISSRRRLLGLGRLGFRSCSGECRPPGGGGIVGACEGGRYGSTLRRWISVRNHAYLARSVGYGCLPCGFHFCQAGDSFTSCTFQYCYRSCEK
jgi:hypothetical protein